MLMAEAEQRKKVGVHERLFLKGRKKEAEKSWTELCNKAFCLKKNQPFHP